jgi:hypothetical protein
MKGHHYPRCLKWENSLRSMDKASLQCFQAIGRDVGIIHHRESLYPSVLKIDDFALDLLIFLGAVAFTDEEMQEYFVCLHSRCRSMRRSSSPSVRDERAEGSFKHFKNMMVLRTQSL